MYWSNPWDLQEGRHLGAGSEGAAYLAADGTVYKITANKNELQLAKYLSKHPDISPLLPIVYETTKKTGDLDYPFGYRREELRDFAGNFLRNQDEEEELDFLFYGAIHNIPKGWKAVEDRVVENIAHLIEKGVPPKPRVVKLVRGFLEEMFDIYQEHKIFITDVRTENLGLRGKQIVIRDIGHGWIK